MISHHLTRPALRAFVQIFCAGLPGVAAGRRTFIQEKTVQDVLACLDLMPRYMRLGLVVWTAVFEWSGLLWRGKRFSRQAAKARERQVRFWGRGRIPAGRELIRFYQKMSIFIYCAQFEKEGLPHE